MIVKYLIIMTIILYFCYVIYRKINKIKKGEFCCDNCENCTMKCKKKGDKYGKIS